MASENKKRKSRNSYCENGCEKYTHRMKRWIFFNKKQRNLNKKIEADEY